MNDAGFVLHRSYLYAPGSNETLVGKVLEAGADAVVLDLEDAVPSTEKDSARAAVATAVSGSAGVAGCAVHVRINGVAGGYSDDDLRAVAGPGLDGLRLPKCESAESVRSVADVLDRLEVAAGMERGSIRLYPIIESAAGALAALEIAAAPRVARLAFGASDFLADIGAFGEEATLHIRSHLVLVSRAAGVGPPIDSVHTHLDDVEGLRATAERARGLGFFGKSVIHPSHIPAVHEVFTPTDAELAWAKRIVGGLDEALAAGSATTTVDGEFVDPAVAARARGLLRLAGLQKENE